MAQKIDSDELPSATATTGGKLRFVGTVELGGTITGQMLGILFGPESAVDGTLTFDGPVRIEGTFKGSIRTDELLVVGEHARIDAHVTCGSAVVQGQVNGNVTARESVALEGRARLKGDITAPSLSVAAGAVFDGLSRMGTLPAKPKRPGRS